jgi:hypothetical protein
MTITESVEQVDSDLPAAAPATIDEAECTDGHLPASLVHIDPRVLAANPANVRSNLGDLASLVASIRSVGVIEPLIVIPDHDGGHLIVAGHRRNAAAIAARPGGRACHRPGGGDAGRE